jgi:hypothetical protein
LRAVLASVIGTLNRCCGCRTVRCLGLARNALELRGTCVADNLRRAARLQTLANG